MSWNPLLGHVYLSRRSQAISVQGKTGSIVFAHPFDSPVGMVTVYVLPNSVEWKSFPEIQQAHQIVEEKLLVGEWAGCSINREGHAYTATAPRYEETDPWYIEVDLVCGGQWRQAALWLDTDGSYSRLEVR